MFILRIIQPLDEQNIEKIYVDRNHAGGGGRRRFSKNVINGINYNKLNLEKSSVDSTPQRISCGSDD